MLELDASTTIIAGVLFAISVILVIGIVFIVYKGPKKYKPIYRTWTVEEIKQVIKTRKIQLKLLEKYPDNAIIKRDYHKYTKEQLRKRYEEELTFLKLNQHSLENIETQIKVLQDRRDYLNETKKEDLIKKAQTNKCPQCGSDDIGKFRQTDEGYACNICHAEFGTNADIENADPDAMRGKISIRLDALESERRNIFKQFMEQSICR